MKAKFKEYYYQFYGDRDDVDQKYHELMEIIAEAKKTRSPELKKQDKKGNKWYFSQNNVGIMLYVDKFSKNLKGFEKRIDYLVDLGVTYVHFMPLLKSREGNNDGGYAVADYLDVDSKFGTMKQFEKVIALLKEKGIRTCIDFVLNHTAKEHIWAKKFIAGDPEYDDMYIAFDNKEICDQYEATLTEIFPEVAPKNFTYYPEINKYVMTRFYEFQWDLNYASPQVFNEIAKVLVTLANKGIDIFRMDAIPYMWKKLHTSSMNLPEVHTLLRMYEMIAEEVCPSVIFLGEAIVEPHEIVKYFGSKEEKECQVMYNASMMVLLWNSLATKDVRLMSKSLLKDYGTPEDGVWINYARCHDDIGWGFEKEIISELGFDPEMHKQFIIQYMLGTYPGSYAIGELYEFNPVTLDARNSGTMASLCGLEQAIIEKDHYKLELAIKRILLLNAIMISYSGIPLLYSGDEIGLMNYWKYKEDPDIAGDSRWLHRPPFDWKKAAKRHDVGTNEGKIFTAIQQMIKVRKKYKEFHSLLHSYPIELSNQTVFAFHKEGKMLVLANFSQIEQKIDGQELSWFGLPEEMHDMLQGKKVSLHGPIVLGPYEYLWLK